jgi:AcrR family transcriptional regulator
VVATTEPVSAGTEGPRSKRGLILAAAIDGFGERGYEHTKWAKIADDVGIGQTALYHYFESKAHCLLTIMSLELGRSLDAFRRATADVSPADRALEAAVVAAYDVSAREILQMRILQSHLDLLCAPRHSEREEAERVRATELAREIEDEWTALLERGMAAGTFVRRDPRVMATLILAMLVSAWRGCRPGGATALDEVRDLVAGACLRVVR